MLEDLKKYLDEEEIKKLEKIECYLNLLGYHLYGKTLHDIANFYIYYYECNDNLLDIEFFILNQKIYSINVEIDTRLTNNEFDVKNMEELEELLLMIL